jgi:hypothetical protein
MFVIPTRFGTRQRADSPLRCSTAAFLLVLEYLQRAAVADHQVLMQMPPPPFSCLHSVLVLRGVGARAGLGADAQLDMLCLVIRIFADTLLARKRHLTYLLRCCCAAGTKNLNCPNSANVSAWSSNQSALATYNIIVHAACGISWISAPEGEC